MNLRVRRLTIAVAVATTAAATAAAPSAAQTPTPVLSVSPATLPANAVVDVTVTGTNYLRPLLAPGESAFGGVYLFFGWVSDPNHFGPSLRNSDNNDGTFGHTYAYPGSGGDAGTRDDGTGAIRLVSFTEGGESGAATDYHMDDQGNWATTLRIYGSTFTSTVPTTGETLTFDCLQVQCGVFTIGAHGIASATNEKFFPITFTTEGAAPPTPAPTQPPTTAPSPAPAPSAAPTTVSPPTTAAPATGDSTASTTMSPPPGPVDTTADTGQLVPAGEAAGDDHDDTPGGDIDSTAITSEAAVAGVTSTTDTGSSLWVLFVVIAVLAVVATALSIQALRRRSDVPTPAGGSSP